MEELYQDQDQETVIQQLRLLLASKEEELHKMRGAAENSGDGESVTDQLINELEDKKNEVTELRSRLKDAETSSKEKLSRLADALDKKDKIIAELQSHSAEEHSGNNAQTSPNNPGETECIIKELEEKLNEKEQLLAEAYRERDRISTEVEQVKSEEHGASGGGTIAMTLARAEGEAAIAERAQLQADLDQLRDEMDTILKRDLESREKYEERIAELDKQVIELQQQCEESLSNRIEAVAEASPAPHDIHLGVNSSGTSDTTERIRTLEITLDEKDLSYRTVQAQLHRLRMAQHLLRGLCAGLGVILLFVLSIKTKHPHAPHMEAGPIFSPPAITEGAADVVKSGASSPAEIPANSVGDPEPDKPVTVEEIIMPEPVTQVASSEAAGKPDDRIVYTVQKGDSLWLICKRMLGEGEAMSRIARENNIADPRALKIGDVIYLSRK
jgi:hypothetical protein